MRSVVRLPAAHRWSCRAQGRVHAIRHTTDRRAGASERGGDRQTSAGQAHERQAPTSHKRTTTPPGTRGIGEHSDMVSRTLGEQTTGRSGNRNPTRERAAQPPPRPATLPCTSGACVIAATGGPRFGRDIRPTIARLAEPGERRRTERRHERGEQTGADRARVGAARHRERPGDRCFAPARSAPGGVSALVGARSRRCENVSGTVLAAGGTIPRPCADDPRGDADGRHRQGPPSSARAPYRARSPRSRVRLRTPAALCAARTGSARY